MRNTLLNISAAVSMAVGSLLRGIIRQALENLSTMTRIQVNPSERSRFVMKSTEGGNLQVTKTVLHLSSSRIWMRL